MKKQFLFQPPSTEQVLWQNAQAIAGLSLGYLAQQLGLITPDNLRRDKGWVGQLLEQVLGATAGNEAEADFQHLGIELKTLPLNKEGKPSESTFVNTVSLLDVSNM